MLSNWLSIVSIVIVPSLSDLWRDKYFDQNRIDKVKSLAGFSINLEQVIILLTVYLF